MLSDLTTILSLGTLVASLLADDDEGCGSYEDEGHVGDHWGSSASGILLTTGEQVLLLLRSPHVLDPGVWGIPGGAIPVDCHGRPMDSLRSALRETLEELGIDRMPPADVVGQVVYRDGDFTFTTHIVWLGHQDAASMRPQLNWESDDHRWFSEAELREAVGRQRRLWAPQLHPGVVYVLRQAWDRIFRVPHLLEDLGGWEEWLDVLPPKQLEELLEERAEVVDLGDGRVVYLLEDDDEHVVVADDEGGYDLQRVDELVFDADLDEVFPGEDELFNRDFWTSPVRLYHATVPEKASIIEAGGLEARDESRGIANRGTGHAVFTTSSEDEAHSGDYGSVVYAIDMAAMKADGFTPYVALEGPVLEYELRHRLAGLLNADELPIDMEQGISPYTVVVFSDIPARYLTRVD